MRIVERIWKWLLILGAPFFFCSVFEILILTAINGPQMLFFSLMHGAYGPLTYIILPSALFYALSLIATILAIIMLAIPKFRPTVTLGKQLYAGWVYIINGMLLATYNDWAYFIFSKST